MKTTRFNEVKGFISTLSTPKVLMTLLTMAFVTALLPEVVYAANPLINNDLVDGGMNFLTDVIPLAGIVGAGGGVGVGLWNLALKASCSEEDVPRYNKRMKGCFITAGVCGLAAGGTFLIDLMTHYTPVVLP